jgi:hypothetical protein
VYGILTKHYSGIQPRQTVIHKVNGSCATPVSCGERKKAELQLLLKLHLSIRDSKTSKTGSERIYTVSVHPEFHRGAALAFRAERGLNMRAPNELVLLTMPIGELKYFHSACYRSCGGFHMHMHGKVVLATLLFAALAFGQLVPAPADAYQLRYAANVGPTSVGDSFVNLTNAGSVGGFEPAGNICANVYTFDSDQQLVSCCACPLTPNHLKVLSVKNDLISNTLTPGQPTEVTIALLATRATCNAAQVAAANLVAGLRAWGTTLHALPGGGWGVGETEFSPAPLSETQLLKMTSYCGFIQANGSGYGICRSCRQGAAGAVRR